MVSHNLLKLFTMNINGLITQGENQPLEFKSAQVDTESLTQEMMAFANNEGGSILIGVEDDGAISGLPNAEKNFEEWVANIARISLITIWMMS